MAEIINEKVFDADKKFVDFAGLDYFWGKAKEYIDDADAALQGVVGDENSGLVKGLKDVQDALADLSGEGTGSVADQISSAIEALDLANTYDAKGAAATAEQNAKDHADGLNTAMDARVAATEAHVADADIHVTVDDKANWNSAKTAIDNFLKDATLTGDVIDTLKEIQSYIDTDGAAADTMTKNIAANAAAIAANAEAIAANTDAIAVINGDAEGSIAKAKADAIAAAEAKVKELEDSLAAKYDALGAADTALATAKKYTDDTIAGLDLANTYEAKGTAADLDAALKTSLEAYADQAEADAIAASNTYAKTYTDLLFDSVKFAETTDIDTIFNKTTGDEGSK